MEGWTTPAAVSMPGEGMPFDLGRPSCMLRSLNLHNTVFGLQEPSPILSQLVSSRLASVRCCLGRLLSSFRRVSDDLPQARRIIGHLKEESVAGSLS